MIGVEFRASVRQVIEVIIVKLGEELVLFWMVSDLDIELDTANSTLQDLGPQLFALQLLVPDYDGVLGDGDSCEACDTVVEHDQVHWDLGDQEREDGLFNFVSIHVRIYH